MVGNLLNRRRLYQVPRARPDSPDVAVGQVVHHSSANGQARIEWSSTLVRDDVEVGKWLAVEIQVSTANLRVTGGMEHVSHLSMGPSDRCG